MPVDNDQFYADLPVNRIHLGKLLLQDKRFKHVPANWHVIITDIKNSTVTVLNGQHENVNLIATGSIVSVLNIAFANNLTIPFFFGGDGATFIVPPSIIDKVMQALLLYKTNTLANFNLELRIGTVPVEDIYAKNFELRIAKYSSSEIFYIPVLLGNGLNYAEKLIKGTDYIPTKHTTQLEELDLSGMQCRWDKIAPPEDKEEVVTLLVVAAEGIRHAAAFSKVMDKIDTIYGSPQKRQPISIAKLKLNTTFSKLGTEMQVRFGRIRFYEQIQIWFTSLLGYVYFRTQSGKTYLKRLVEMSDTLVIDGKINTVISGTIKQRKELQQVLDKLETDAEIIYGLHISTESVMSCYVRDLKDGHIHFVDGGGGGYTQAAIRLKAKLQL